MPIGVNILLANSYYTFPLFFFFLFPELKKNKYSERYPDLAVREINFIDVKI